MVNLAVKHNYAPLSTYNDTETPAKEEVYKTW